MGVMGVTLVLHRSSKFTYLSRHLFSPTGLPVLIISIKVMKLGLKDE